MKLDKKAFDYIKLQHKNGKTYNSCLSDLTTMGYKMANGKQIVDPAIVSQFMSKRGYRARPRRAKQIAMPVSKLKITKSPSIENFLLDVLVNRDLNKIQKIKILQALI